MEKQLQSTISDGDHLSVVFDESTVDLAYASENNWIYLICTDTVSRWPSRLLRTGHALLRISSKECNGYASLVTTDQEKIKIENLFRLKYGDTYFTRYFSHPGRYIRVDISEGRVSWDKDYYEWLAEEFDSESGIYDDHIFGNSINRLLRDRSMEIIYRYLKPSSMVLDIGCGSGTETMEVLKHGCKVVAIDISGGMLNVVEQKAKKSGLLANLSTIRVRASGVDEVLNRYGSQSFDLIYSTYGALNCDPEIERIPPVIAELLRPGGHFIAGVYNKFCLSEFIIQVLFLRFRRIPDRFRNPILEGHSRFCIDVYSFSPGEFNSLFRSHMKLVSISGSPVLIPPSNYRRFMDIAGEGFKKFDRIDRFLSTKWPFSLLGDHFISVFQKK